MTRQTPINGAFGLVALLALALAPTQHGLVLGGIHVTLADLLLAAAFGLALLTPGFLRRRPPAENVAFVLLAALSALFGGSLRGSGNRHFLAVDLQHGLGKVVIHRHVKESVNIALDGIDIENLAITEEHEALTFLKEITGKMGLNLNFVCRTGENMVYVEMSGEDSRTVIGKRGQTLDAIQYLTSLVVNKDNKAYIKVVVDAENYRAKRQRTLEQLAYRLAGKVARTRKFVRLEPMNPYERKVIHATLQSHPDVTTRSEGEEPYRRVIIELKK